MCLAALQFDILFINQEDRDEHDYWFLCVISTQENSKVAKMIKETIVHTLLHMPWKS